MEGDARDFGFLQVWDAVAAAVGTRECVVQGDRRSTWDETAERSRRLGWWLTGQGFGARGEVASWESPNDTVGILLRNRAEFLETTLGCYRARCAPFNVNYRYTGEEVAYLLRDAGAAVLVYQREFAAVVADAVGRLADPPRLVLVEDGSPTEPAAASVEFEQALSDAVRPSVEPVPSPDDVHVLYTGGTTGMPKGVMWPLRELVSGATGAVVASPAAAATKAPGRGWLRALPAPPLMHGAALWFAYNAWTRGATIVLDPIVDRFDADQAVALMRAESVTWLAVVGDVFATPLVAALDRAAADGGVPAALSYVFSSGAALGETAWNGLLRHYPSLAVVNALGSSETGPQAFQTGADRTAAFRPGPDTVVVSEDHRRILGAHDPGVGWLSNGGTLPRGYLGDRARTEQTFREVGGRRVAVSGDRAAVAADGAVTFLGRASNVINTGGEKVYAEEVEGALARHPAVADAVVVGRPSERWGHEVVALVAVSLDVDDAELKQFCARDLAGYKIPKAFLRVPAIRRAPNGKVDYTWAREHATGEPSPRTQEVER
ncbi:fatty-acyl-CoA synthase [Jatrophihabitans endophyticus]|uniref:Fatty-acyl-CoA synthase n=1 Tax=Jatrophihabitans endophyticus TaxID=1206085 RepID=A0A1M5PRK2_9ACTN|nr:AMP-binding protein [Jatrophihabitans endophyticus]SHH04497.1 fatty-acyl-CoA synthase [Jatrophihabitans endophyticus]